MSNCIARLKSSQGEDSAASIGMKKLMDFDVFPFLVADDCSIKRQGMAFRAGDNGSGALKQHLNFLSLQKIPTQSPLNFANPSSHPSNILLVLSSILLPEIQLSYQQTRFISHLDNYKVIG